MSRGAAAARAGSSQTRVGAGEGAGAADDARLAAGGSGAPGTLGAAG